MAEVSSIMEVRAVAEVSSAVEVRAVVELDPVVGGGVGNMLRILG